MFPSLEDLNFIDDLYSKKKSVFFGMESSPFKENADSVNRLFVTDPV